MIEETKTVHTDEVVALTNKLISSEDELQKMTTAYEQERQSAEKATLALEEKLEDAKARQGEIETLTASLKDAETARDALATERDQARKVIEETKTVHTDEVVALTNKLISSEDELQKMTTAYEQERQSAEKAKLALEEKIKEVTVRNEFDTRYQQVHLRLREMLINQLRSRRQLAISERLARKKILKEKARVISKSPVFDGEWYITAYPEVKDSGTDPALHFVAHGFYEGRSPSPDFDYIAYLADRPELLEKSAHSIMDILFQAQTNRTDH